MEIAFRKRLGLSVQLGNPLSGGSASARSAGILAAAFTLLLHVVGLPAEALTPSRCAAPDGAGCCLDPFEQPEISAQWTLADLGDATGGEARIVDGELRLKGTGSSLFRGASNAAYLHDAVSEDFRVEVDVTGVPVDMGGSYRKGVLMVRQSTDPDAALVMVQFVPQHRGASNGPALQFDYRDELGNAGTLASIVGGISLPIRLAIQRVGDTFTVSYSEDGGLHWTHPGGGAKGSIDIDMGPDVLAGVAVASYDPLRPMTVAFDDLGICQPLGPTPTAGTPTCGSAQPLDVVYLVDASDSMARPHGTPATSKLDNARETLRRLHATLGLLDDGSRASLITYSGLRNEPLWNQESGAVVEVGPVTDPAILDTALRALDLPVLDPYEPETATPLALAIDRATEYWLEQGDPHGSPTVVLVADGVPNLDGLGRGSRQYLESEVSPIPLVDDLGERLAPQQVSWLGGFNPDLDAFDGRVLGDAMRAAQRLTESVPGARVFVLVPRGSEALPPVAPEALYEFIAFVTGGAVYGGETASALDAVVPALATAMRCGEAGPGFVEGRLWRDADGDGTRDLGEAGLHGVVVELVSASGSVTSTVTDLDGRYRFEGVAPSTHVVRVDAATLPVDAVTPIADADGVETPHSAEVEPPGWATTTADFAYGADRPRGLYGCIDDEFSSTAAGSDWTSVGLGEVSVAEARVQGGRLELTGDGLTLFERADDAAFYTRTSTGDFRLETTLEGFAGEGGAFHKAGLMVRAGLHPDDARLMVQYSPDYESGRTALQFRYREAYGGDGREEVASDRFDVPLPVRLAIERVGNVYAVEYSTDDGLTWSVPGGADGGAVMLDLGPSPWVGTTVTSYSVDPLTAWFDDLSLCATSADPVPGGGPSVSILPPPADALGVDGEPRFDVGFTAAEGSNGVTRVELIAEGVRVGASELPTARAAGTVDILADFGAAFDGAVDVVAIAWQLESDGSLTWGEATTTVTLDRRAPSITILAPAPATVATTETIELRVAIDEAATVDLAGSALGPTEPGELARVVDLAEGTNLLTVRATDAAGNSAVETVDVLRDSFPPRIHLRHPERGALIVGRPGEPLTTTVIGSVSDLVTGAVNAGDCTVTVNGVPAIVENGDFVALDVPVAIGPGTITAVAQDRSGQRDSTFVEVVGSTEPNAILEVVSGDAQAGIVGSLLPLPLAVRAISNAGEPVAGVPVDFVVTRGDGELGAGIGGGGLRRQTVLTDSDGIARARYALGSRVGAASDQVTARAAGFLGAIEFCAGATVSPAARATLSLVMGAYQRGAAGALAALPLTVRLSDEFGNAMAGRTIEFEVSAGRGRVDGVSRISKTTDADGRAFVLHAFGASTGINSQIVVARYGAETVTFVGSAFDPGEPAETAIRGTVLDNTGQPIPGVAVSITDLLTASSGPDGRFSITAIPEGHVHLVVDGSTAGPFPHLEYELDITSGIEHAMPRPIYLPRIDDDGKASVGADHDAVITRADTPGLEMRIPAGSTTFADGSTEGEVQIIRVQRDKLPMEPPEGTAPRIAFSIQPAGAHFDPPAAIRFPNVEGLEPGRVVSIYSFDHDLGEYVSVGTAQVSEDGAYVASEAGQGIVKGGWHLVPPAPAVVGSLSSSCGTVRCTEAGCELCRDFDCSICETVDPPQYLAVFGTTEAPDTPDVDCYRCPSRFSRGGLEVCTETATVLSKSPGGACIRGLDQQYGLTGLAGTCQIPGGHDSGSPPVCCPDNHWDATNAVCCLHELAPGEACG